MRSLPRRGFTLVEVLVALAVTAFVLVGVMSVFRSQQATYYGSQKNRAAQGAARSAMLFLEAKLPTAGFGLDPSLAFDFGGYPDPITGPCPAEMSGCPRDSTTNSDELVFHARNPAYWVSADPPAGMATPRPVGNAWNLRAVTPPVNPVTIVLSANEGDVFRKGQILQAVCLAGGRYAFATVQTRAVGPADDGDPATNLTADVAIAVEPVSAGNPFRAQDGMVGGCFTQGARVFLVDRYRFHVRPVSKGGGAYDPYLVLDTGVDQNEDGAIDDKDEQLVADGVELLQVAYALSNVAYGDVGVAPGGITLAAGLPVSTATNTITTTKFTTYADTSFMRYSILEPPPERQSNHQANIRAVRVGIVARSPEPDTSAPATFQNASGFKLFNYTGAPAWIAAFATARGGDDGYQRFVVETTAALPNMVARAIPPF